MPILTDGKKVRLFAGEVIVFARVLSIALICFAPTGCVIVDLGVTNPVPEISKIAIVPFFNLSQEESVDGRKFALAYYAELQKVPGYDVVPLGLTEIVMIDNGLEMAGPEDALALIKILNVDAVVIGTVTDYDPYYPPRIGMQIDWYALNPPEFAPGVQTDTEHRTDVRSLRKDREKAIGKQEKARRKEEKRQQKLAEEAAKQQVSEETDPQVIRGQSFDSPRVRPNMRADLSSREWQPSNSEYGVVERPNVSLRELFVEQRQQPENWPRARQDGLHDKPPGVVRTSRLVGFESEFVSAGEHQPGGGRVSANPSSRRPLSPEEALIPQVLVSPGVLVPGPPPAAGTLQREQSHPQATSLDQTPLPQVLISPGVLVPAHSPTAQTLRKAWNESASVTGETTPLPQILVSPGVLIPARPRETREPRRYRMSQWGDPLRDGIPIAQQSPAQAQKPVPMPTLTAPPLLPGPPLVEELPPPDESEPLVVPRESPQFGQTTPDVDGCPDCLPPGSEQSDSPIKSPQPVTVYDPRKTFMSYTRLFDGADADLTANLRDYVELRGDDRSGGWQAYLRRSDDFIRFAAHRMIVEMLTLHGGEGRRRIIFKMRKFR